VHGIIGPILCEDGPLPFHIESSSMCAF